MDRQDKERLCGEVYSSLWSHYKGALFDQYTWHIWNELNTYAPFLNPKIKDGVCLDAGCGSGRAMAAMLAVGATRVEGLDISPVNVTVAADNLSAFGDRVGVRQGSVITMPYDDETFDVVHCYGVLHHTKDPYKGFQECCRVLKPGGTLLVANYCRGGLVNRVLDLGRFFTTRRIPPLSVMKRISRAIFGEDDRHYWYALLDGLYAPFRETYTEQEMRTWFEENHLDDVQRYYCKGFYYDWPPLFSGKDRGLIVLVGQKAAA